MKYLFQFSIILFISALGEMIRYLIPFPIPASIYGMTLLFLALIFKIIKVEQVKQTGDFLIEIMPMLFIPAGVGLLSSWNAISGIWLQLIVIIAVSTSVVMGVSGLITQKLIRKDGNRYE